MGESDENEQTDDVENEQIDMDIEGRDESEEALI